MPCPICNEGDPSRTKPHFNCRRMARIRDRAPDLYALVRTLEAALPPTAEIRWLVGGKAALSFFDPTTGRAYTITATRSGRPSGARAPESSIEPLDP